MNIIVIIQKQILNRAVGNDPNQLVLVRFSEFKIALKNKIQGTIY